jgi:hypothetical protein
MQPITIAVWLAIVFLFSLASYLLGRRHGFHRGVAHGVEFSAQVVHEHGGNRRLRRAFKSKMNPKKKVPRK